ncbi:pilus assembly protein PilP [Undibacterium sp. TC4M20W]|uniref:pilus assembly protein PilP n=1 Tax=Undibacterium sp. TC4M20W TaxID=3413052 RepID=UPI003BF300B5
MAMKIRLALRFVLPLTLLVMAAPSSATFPISELELLTYDKMLLTGTAQPGKAWIACIKTSDGKQVTVKKGDTLGPQLGRILKIDAKGIYLAETVQLNVSEWFERKLFWPVVSDKTLSAECKWIAAPDKRWHYPSHLQD